MNAYYVIRSSSDPEITGLKKGGSQVLATSEKFSDQKKASVLSDFITRGPAFWDHVGNFPEEEIVLENIPVEKGTKLTDFLSFGPGYPGMRFLVNEEMIRILKSHKLPPYKLYDASLITKSGVNNDYKLFYCPPLKNDIVDFSKTRFSYSFVIKEDKLFTVENNEEFLELHNEKVFKTFALALNSRFDQSLDLFGTQVDYDMYISQRLKEALEAANCTGINIVPPREPILVLP
jgi:hypothetical protein